MLHAHLEKLVAFKAIAESGSIRKAADRIGIAQPALTRSMKVLEGAVGADLFKRSVRGIRLTREGDLLLEFASMVLKEAEDVHVQINADENQLAGVLNVGTFASISMYLWPRVLARLQKVLPSIEIRLKTREEDHIESLSRGLLDLVVDAEPRPRSNMICTKLYEDKFNFFAGLDGDFRKDVFIFAAKSYDEDDKTILDHLHKNGHTNFSTPYEIDSFETAKALASRGIGIGVLPERVALDALKTRQIRRVSVRHFPAAGFGRHKICATIREEDRTDRRISAVIKEMKSILA